MKSPDDTPGLREFANSSHSKGELVNKVRNSIVLIDDNEDRRHSLSATLRRLKFHAHEAANCSKAINTACTSTVDLCLLQMSSLQMNLDACRHIREAIDGVSILIMTRREHPEDTVSALEVGADDCIPTPLYFPELLAQMRAAIRRRQEHLEEILDPVTIGDIEFRLADRSVTKAGRRLHFSPKEFALLRSLIVRSGKPISHARLLAEAWGTHNQSNRECLRTHICQIRKKLEDNPAEPKYLLTDSHFGYRLEAAVCEVW
jgi:two-component system KDP operon response regulator KdpE